jgi:hypothetical protein
MLSGFHWCTEVRDLGVLVDHKLLFNQHTANITHKARVRARLVIRSFCSKDSSVLIKAFVTYVRLMLEYCSVQAIYMCTAAAVGWAGRQHWLAVAGR